VEGSTVAGTKGESEGTHVAGSGTEEEVDVTK